MSPAQPPSQLRGEAVGSQHCENCYPGSNKKALEEELVGTLTRSLVSKGPGERCPQPVGSGVFRLRRSLVSVNDCEGGGS